ncbi:MAG: hypothetical protein Q9211_005113 [Gyalolechia sp. 1 TL-2023]
MELVVAEKELVVDEKELVVDKKELVVAEKELVVDEWELARAVELPRRVLLVRRWVAPILEEAGKGRSVLVVG